MRVCCCSLFGNINLHQPNAYARCMVFVSNVNRSFRMSKKESKKVSYFRSTVVVAGTRVKIQTTIQWKKNRCDSDTTHTTHTHTRILANTDDILVIRFPTRAAQCCNAWRHFRHQFDPVIIPKLQIHKLMAWQCCMVENRRPLKQRKSIVLASTRFHPIEN